MAIAAHTPFGFVCRFQRLVHPAEVIQDEQLPVRLLLHRQQLHFLRQIQPNRMADAKAEKATEKTEAPPAAEEPASSVGTIDAVTEGAGDEPQKQAV